MQKLHTILGNICRKFPEHELILVGDLNLPGFDWTQKRLKNCCTHKQIHTEFLHILSEFMLEQLITDPTHVRGNTLDLICTNDPGHVEKTEIFQPGLSDHHIVTATLKHNTSKVAIKEEHTIRLYKKVDQLSFHQDMLQLSKDLEEIDDPNDM